MSTKNYFQKRADQFDSLYDEESKWHYWFNQIFRKGLFERVALTAHEIESIRGGTVLDVGCGSGRNSIAFAKAGAQHIVGIDFSERMVELATAFSRKHDMGAVCTFIEGDFLSYAFDRKFDVVVALGVFDYLAKPQSFLRRMVELTQRKVIASFPKPSLVRAPLRKVRYALRNCPVYFYTPNRLVDICKDIGLSNYRILNYTSGLFLVGHMDRNDMSQK